MTINETIKAAMKELGRRGGTARAKNMTAKQRTASARKAGKAGAAARWGKKNRRTR